MLLPLIIIYAIVVIIGFLYLIAVETKFYKVNKDFIPDRDRHVTAILLWPGVLPVILLALVIHRIADGYNWLIKYLSQFKKN